MLKQEPYNPSIFITYANTPLRNNSAGLYATLGQIEKYLTPLHSEIKEKVDRLVEVDKLTYRNSIKEIYEDGQRVLKKILAKEEQLVLEIYRQEKFHKETREVRFKVEDISPEEKKMEQALKAEAKIDGEKITQILQGVFGSQLTKCDYDPEFHPLGCRWSKIRKELFATKDLKCYECDHQYFVYILKALVEGKEYSEIAGLNSLVDSYQPPKTILKISQGKNSQFVETLDQNSLRLSYGGFMAFPRIFYGSVTQSLLEFLIHNDRKRLKRCAVCEKFFIAMHSRRDICSSECHDLYMRDYLREYMRKKRDKEGSDFDPRYI
jgi:hypothetical protein